MLTAAHAGPGDLSGKRGEEAGRAGGGRRAPASASWDEPRLTRLSYLLAHCPPLQTQLRHSSGPCCSQQLPRCPREAAWRLSVTTATVAPERFLQSVLLPVALPHLCLHRKGPWLSSVSPHSSLAQLVICRPAQAGTSPAGGGPWVPTRFASRGNSARLRAPAAAHLAPGHPDQIQTQANAAVVPQRGRYTPPGGKKVFETC